MTDGPLIEPTPIPKARRAHPARRANERRVMTNTLSTATGWPRCSPTPTGQPAYKASLASYMAARAELVAATGTGAANWPSTCPSRGGLGTGVHRLAPHRRRLDDWLGHTTMADIARPGPGRLNGRRSWITATWRSGHCNGRERCR